MDRQTERYSQAQINMDTHVFVDFTDFADFAQFDDLTNLINFALFANCAVFVQFDPICRFCKY